MWLEPTCSSLYSIQQSAAKARKPRQPLPGYEKQFWFVVSLLGICFCPNAQGSRVWTLMSWDGLRAMLSPAAALLGPEGCGVPEASTWPPEVTSQKIVFATLLPLITNLIKIKWKTVTLFDVITSQYIRCLSSSSSVWDKRVTQPSLIKSFWSRSLLPAKGVCEAISFSEITEKIPRSS